MIMFIDDENQLIISGNPKGGGGGGGGGEREMYECECERVGVSEWDSLVQ